MNIWQERILEALEASNMFDTTKLRELQVQDKTGKQFMEFIARKPEVYYFFKSEKAC